MGTRSRCRISGGVVLSTEVTSSDCATTAVQSGRLLHLIKENRIEAMIVTILLYSTGLLEKAVAHASGVCG